MRERTNFELQSFKQIVWHRSGMNENPNAKDSPKTLLICHEGAELDREGLARWLASFSELVGIIVLRERPQRMWRRIKRELKRVGPVRFLDVLAFRAYYKIFISARDRAWEERRLQSLRDRYPVLPKAPTLVTHSPNSSEAERFIRDRAPDIMIARCKTLLKENIFSIPRHGTFVMHPGICPEYRNAHGCFWALANGDADKVGMTLLRIDKGVDTGPIYGYYGCDYDAARESHIVIQHRVVLDNLPAIRDRLLEIHRGEAIPLDIQGRESAAWGQPWLSHYLRIKRQAKRRSV